MNCKTCNNQITNRGNRKYCSTGCYHKSIDIKFKEFDRNCKNCNIHIDLRLAKDRGLCCKCKKITERLEKREKFIEKANLIHNNEYDYSKVEYINNETNVIIICKQHGEFLQTPTGHNDAKSNCPKCINRRTSDRLKSNTNRFIESARKIHGDLYSYERTQYIQSNKPVEIVCKIHGSFFQTPNSHLSRKCGCAKCGGGRISKSSCVWLDSLNIDLIREYNIPNTSYKADGYDIKTNTIYEYLGVFWHGYPERYDCGDTNTISNKTFGQMFEETIDRLAKIKSLGYNLVYIWGD